MMRVRAGFCAKLRFQRQMRDTPELASLETTSAAHGFFGAMENSANQPDPDALGFNSRNIATSHSPETQTASAHCDAR